MQAGLGQYDKWVKNWKASEGQYNEAKNVRRSYELLQGQTRDDRATDKIIEENRMRCPPQSSQCPCTK